jgi:hypothetical protein
VQEARDLVEILDEDQDHVVERSVASGRTATLRRHERRAVWRCASVPVQAVEDGSGHGAVREMRDHIGDP